jgi:pyruvate formate lyase activating enzyme
MSSEYSGIIGWQKNSFIDFPGTISTVLFFRGCNLRCPYCHNPDIVNNRLPEIPFPTIIEHLSKRKGIIDGVVLSGGEPTIHESLSSVVIKLRTLGLKIKIDTNGLNPVVIKLTNPDYLALDLKTSLNRYNELGCLANGYEERIQETLEIVKRMGDHAEVRITVAPGFIGEHEIENIALQVRGVKRIFLQPVQLGIPLLDQAFEERVPVTEEEIAKYCEILSNVVGHCTIRGRIER